MVLAAFAASAASPAAAHATTVEQAGGDLFVRDTAGVDDRLLVAGSMNSGLTIRSTDGKNLTAGSGCVQKNPTTVTCGGNEAFFSLGGGADTVTDRSDLAGVIDGEGGNDTYVDLNRSSRGGTNVTFRGGPGVDLVSYRDRTEAVTVTLDDLPNDGAGENDSVRSDVEHVVGGGGNDSLSGSGSINRLQGVGGNDVLNGLAGADVLIGGAGNDTELGGVGDDKLGSVNTNRAAADDPGADVFKGEAGADQLFTNDGVPDTRQGEASPIDCGSELDLATIDLEDQASVGCESEQRAATDQHPTVQVSPRVVMARGGRVAVRLLCPRTVPGDRCSGSIRIVKGRRLLARGRYRLRAGRGRTVKLRLRRRARGRAELRTSERDTRGRPERTRTRIRLRG